MTIERSSDPKAGGRALGKPSNIVLLYTARALRGFADGFAIIVLPAYLTEIGFTTLQVGLVATAALLGTAVVTLGIGHVASRRDLRNLLIASAVTMIGTGLGFANVAYLPLVLAVAFVGTANPSSGDIGMFVPLEHAMLATDATDHSRTQVFARYSMIGGLSAALGALSASAPDLIVSFGVNKAAALRTMLYLYAALGVLCAALYRLLPHAQVQSAGQKPSPLRPSRRIIYRLAALFSVDAFAGGFAVQSLVALWLFERFDMSLAEASVFFFWSNTLAAFSYPAAARLAKRFGLINTMVFTHIPSSMCLILAALVPNLTFVLLLLLIRSALSQMDVPTRTSYVMAMVTPSERPAAASLTAVPRSLASAISPTLAGALLSTSFAGLPLVICGALKIAYDVALLLSFRHLRPPEEQDGTTRLHSDRADVKT